MGKLTSFKELKTWQKGTEIAKSVYALVQKFPKEESAGLASLIKRSAISIPSYVAEGFLRFYKAENKQSLKMALGSVAELETQLSIAQELNLVKTSELGEISEKIDHITRMIITALKNLSDTNGLPKESQQPLIN